MHCCIAIVRLLNSLKAYSTNREPNSARRDSDTSAVREPDQNSYPKESYILTEET